MNSYLEFGILWTSLVTVVAVAGSIGGSTVNLYGLLGLLMGGVGSLLIGILSH